MVSCRCENLFLILDPIKLSSSHPTAVQLATHSAPSSAFIPADLQSAELPAQGRQM